MSRNFNVLTTEGTEFTENRRINNIFSVLSIFSVFSGINIKREHFHKLSQGNHTPGCFVLQMQRLKSRASDLRIYNPVHLYYLCASLCILSQRGEVTPFFICMHPVSYPLIFSIYLYLRVSCSYFLSRVHPVPYTSSRDHRCCFQGSALLLYPYRSQ
jgi:hypothetical protein